MLRLQGEGREVRAAAVQWCCCECVWLGSLWVQLVAGAVEPLFLCLVHAGSTTPMVCAAARVISPEDNNSVGKWSLPLGLAVVENMCGGQVISENATVAL